jgi:hypothetical protein
MNEAFPATAPAQAPPQAAPDGLGGLDGFDPDRFAMEAEDEIFRNRWADLAERFRRPGAALAAPLVGRDFVHKLLDHFVCHGSWADLETLLRAGLPARWAFSLALAANAHVSGLDGGPPSVDLRERIAALLPLACEPAAPGSANHLCLTPLSSLVYYAPERALLDRAMELGDVFADCENFNALSCVAHSLDEIIHQADGVGVSMVFFDAVLDRMQAQDPARLRELALAVANRELDGESDGAQGETAGAASEPSLHDAPYLPVGAWHACENIILRGLIPDDLALRVVAMAMKSDGVDMARSRAFAESRLLAAKAGAASAGPEAPATSGAKNRESAPRPSAAAPRL